MGRPKRSTGISPASEVVATAAIRPLRTSSRRIRRPSRFSSEADDPLEDLLLREQDLAASVSSLSRRVGASQGTRAAAAALKFNAAPVLKNETRSANSRRSRSNQLRADPCPHFAAFDATRAKEWLLDPSRWHCQECQTTESVFACLHCAFFGCGHDCNNHFNTHCHLFPTHAICVEVNERAVYCALCDNPLQLTDHSSNNNVQDLQLLLQELNDEQTLPPLHLDTGAILETRPATVQSATRLSAGSSGSAVVSASEISSPTGRKRRQSSIFGRSAADFERRDQLVTLLKRWQLLPLANAFHTWRQFVLSTNRSSPPSHRRSSSISDIPEALTVTFDSDYMTSQSSQLAVKLPRVALRNLGNTCYMNSVIQALHSTQLVRRFFLHPELLSRELERQSAEKARTLQLSMATHSDSDVFELVQRRESPTVQDEALSRELHNLFRLLKSRQYSILTPYSLLAHIWRAIPTFANHQQHDASEFLSLFLDKLSTELSGIRSGSSNSVVQQSLLRTHIFSGILTTTITCSKCRMVQQSTEPFYSVELDIPQHAVVLAGRRAVCLGSAQKRGPMLNLENLLEQFCAEEAIEYHCGRCKLGNRGTAIRRTSISQLPNVLVFQIKRFVWLAERRVGAKISTNVRFPVSGLLDMSAYISAPTSQPESLFSLRAVVVHEGSRITSGHYYTFGYEHGANSDGGTWIDFNDARVSPVTADRVEQSEAYLLFYERVAPSLNAGPEAQLRSTIMFSPPETSSTSSEHRIDDLIALKNPSPKISAKRGRAKPL